MDCKLLECLYLEKNAISNESLLNFCESGLDIRELNISSNGINGNSLKNISNFKNLSILKMEKNPKIRNGLAFIKGLDLSLLDASDCGIDDRGLVNFLRNSKSTNLNLYIPQNRFTNIAAKELVNYGGKIWRLTINGTNIDSKWIEKLKQVIPHVKITHRDPLSEETTRCLVH